VKHARSEMSLSIVIPAFNEEATLGTVIAGCLDTFDSDPRLAEIVVVDDSSSDRTAEVAKEFARRDQRIRLLGNAERIGCVPSVVRGFEHAGGEFVFFMPADEQVPPSIARRCLDVAADGYDVVVTRRSRRQDPWYRILLSTIYNRLIRLIVSDFPATDIDSSSLFRRSTIAENLDSRRATAFALVRFVLAARGKGASIMEIEIPHLRRSGGRAHGVRMREILAGVKGLLTLLRWRVRRDPVLKRK
jgi:glycosyltransferase involved in cell wall biosynthesis